MTIEEASKKYCIPINILKEYEAMGLCDEVKKVMGVWQYDDVDIERLSMIMTLYQIGFNKDEVNEYMKILLNDSSKEMISQILKRKRKNTLDEIHFKEQQLNTIDYLTHEINQMKEYEKHK